MSDIKTKESVKDIKLLDKASNAAKNIRKATVRTKDGIENLVDDGAVSPSEYAEDRVKYVAEDAVEEVYDESGKRFRQARDRVRDQVRENRDEKRLEKQRMRTEKAIENFDNAQPQSNTVRTKETKRAHAAERRTVRRAKRVKRATVRTTKAVAQNATTENARRNVRSAVRAKNTGIRTAQATERSIKQTAKSTGKATVKTSQKSAKTVQRTVKTAEQTSKAAIKTTKVAAETTKKTAEASAKAAKAAAIAAKKVTVVVAKAAVAAAKVVAKVAVAVGKAIVSAFQALVAALGAGGAIAVVAVVIICAIGLIVGSAYGIFFSSEDTSGGRTMESVVREINESYLNKIDGIKSSESYEEVEMTGSAAVWREVLAVYAVKINLDPESGQDVASLSEEKIAMLEDIFWAMNTIEHEVRTETKTVIEEEVGEDGEIIEVEVEKEVTTLYIKVHHRTADEMAAEYGFSESQTDQMKELLSDEYRSLWAAVLYGIRSDGTPIVKVALSQIGNVGGEPYWSWFGFTSRIEWCACFVSWCGNECGYIDDGVMPKAIGCVVSMNWYKERGLWLDGNQEPVPGMIIFYDWDDPDGEFGPQDGKPDHTGIVVKVENGIVWTIEGNSGDACRMNQHPVGEYVIMGYGCPRY